MPTKRSARQQYEAFANQTAAQAGVQRLPRLRTVRMALGMSGEQLGRKMDLTRARISQIEQAEMAGTANLKAMQAMAEAMGCQFVYAIVPPGTLEGLVLAQARKKAENIVVKAIKRKALSENEKAQEIERLAFDMAHRRPSDLWDED